MSQLQAAGARVRGFTHAELDIAEPDAVARVLDDIRPRVLLNAAAFTHVDRCESEPEAASRANAEGPKVLAKACQARGVRLVHVSTDYVFAGDAATPYREEDRTDPQSAYGRTKRDGEVAVLAALSDALVVRTSWVFGHGRNFIAAVLAQARLRRRGEAEGPLRVVDDQRGSPTYAWDLAGAIRQLVEAGAEGLYHISNAGEATWWDLARFCLDESGYPDVEIERIRTETLNLPAHRPTWSVLDGAKAAGQGVRMRSWQDAVRAYLESEDAPPGARHPLGDS